MFFSYPLVDKPQHLAILIHCSVFTSYSVVSHFKECHVNEIIKHIFIYAHFLSLSVIFLKFLNAMASISSLFLFVAEYNPTEWVRHNWFIRLPVDGRLGCCQFQVIMRKAAINIGMFFCAHMF